MGNTRRRQASEPVVRRPATTPEERENQMISLAVELTERQLRDGTASAQVITHYLKLGSSREKLEQEKISLEKDLLQVRADTMAAAKRMETIYEEALDAMRIYQGQDDYYGED